MPVNVAIIGAGMYVCGAGTRGHGTVLPAVLQASRDGLVGRVCVAARRREAIRHFDVKLRELEALQGFKLDCATYPRHDDDSNAYKAAIRDLPDPGAVIVVTPDHLHAEIAMEAIAAGKHVLVAKPLAPTVAQARMLADAAKERGVYGAVEFHKRWDFANRQLKEMVCSGAVGRPLYFHVEYSQRSEIPASAFASWVEKTSVFQYLGVHYVDIIRFVTGAVPRRVMALGQWARLAETGADAADAMQVVVEWDQGFVSTLLTNWIDPATSTAMSQQAIKIVGTEGRIESDQTDRGLSVVNEGRCLEKINPYFCRAYRDETDGRLSYLGYGIDSIRQFLSDVDDVAEKRRSLCDLAACRPTFEEGVLSTAVIEGAELSLRRGGQWVGFGDGMQPVAD